MAKYKTSQRKNLTDFLKNNPDKRFSVKEIYEALEDSSISLSAVYRNVSELEKDGIINRFAKDGSREITYQYVHCEECRNCLHLTCVRCGKTFHMDKNQAEAISSALKTTEGFELNRAKTVLYGSCSECTGEV